MIRSVFTSNIIFRGLWDHYFPPIHMFWSHILPFWYCIIRHDGHIHTHLYQSVFCHVSELSLSLMPTSLVKPERGISLYGAVNVISPCGGLCRYQRLTKEMKIEASQYNNSYLQPSKLTDSVKASPDKHSVRCRCIWLLLPMRMACVCFFVSGS